MSNLSSIVGGIVPITQRTLNRDSSYSQGYLTSTSATERYTYNGSHSTDACGSCCSFPFIAGLAIGYFFSKLISLSSNNRSDDD